MSAGEPPPATHAATGAGPAPGPPVRQFTIGADDEGIRLDRWFQRHLPEVGFATVSRWARTGQIRLDGKRARPEDRVARGQVLRVPPGTGAARGRQAPPRRELSDEERAAAAAMLIARTAAALVLNKPPGLATQGGLRTSRHVDGLLDAFGAEGEPRPRLVHRLDKDTSGVLLVARTPGSAAFFSRHFAGRSAKKIYWALVVGVPDVAEGTIEAPIAKQPGTGGEKMQVDYEGGQPAKTAYRVIDRAGNRAAWVELQPFTGRTHQLRVHMAAIGHPIVGDGKYGGQAAFLTGAISRKMHLHARRLIIDEPGGAKIDVTASLPEHFDASLAQLGFDPAASRADPVISPPEPRTKQTEKQAARQHAKQYRKARRGERRERGGGSASTGRSAGARPKASGPKASGGKSRASPRSGKGPGTGPGTGPGAGPRPGRRP